MDDVKICRNCIYSVLHPSEDQEKILGCKVIGKGVFLSINPYAKFCEFGELLPCFNKKEDVNEN